MNDYISKEEVMSIIANMQEEHHYDAANLEDRYVVAHLLEVADKIKDLKAADVQSVVHGYWKEFEIRGTLTQSCSVCGSDCGVLYSYDFCPNCGARMDLKDGDTE